jgi:hypothetical protein
VGDGERIRRAIEQWLKVRGTPYTDRADAVAAKLSSDDELFEAFAAEWNGDDPAIFAAAFKRFRSALLSDSTYTITN